MIKRQYYLKQLVRHKDRPIIKVVTGMRRVGKSVLLFDLYADYLELSGVKKDHIIKVNLEEVENTSLRDAQNFYNFCIQHTKDSQKYYVMIDEIQFMPNFEDLVNSLNNKNYDVYVTGSNSHLLSSDINTALRGRSIEIRVMPLSFSEYYEYKGGDRREALKEYMLYGGLPYVATLPDEQSKIEYLKMINNTVVTKDIIDRHAIKNVGVFQSLVNFMYSNIGSIVSTNKITTTLKHTAGIDTTVDTIANYLAFLSDAFLFYKVFRYDIKGKEYLKSLNKYYVADLGIRNAHLDFRQIEPTHALENLVFIELVRRGFSINIGINGNKEVDFIATKAQKLYYIQVAYSIEDMKKRATELASFKGIDDGYQKIVITMDDDPFDDLGDGYRKINIFDFLLNPNLS